MGVASYVRAMDKVYSVVDYQSDLGDYELYDWKHMSVAEKRRVLVQWRRFLRGGFEEKHFQKALYWHLSGHCSFSAWNGQRGFYGQYFLRMDMAERFLRQFVKEGEWKCVELGHTWWLGREGEYRDLNEAMCAEAGFVFQPLEEVFVRHMKKALDSIGQVAVLLGNKEAAARMLGPLMKLTPAIRGELVAAVTVQFEALEHGALQPALL